MNHAVVVTWVNARLFTCIELVMVDWIAILCWNCILWHDTDFELYSWSIVAQQCRCLWWQCRQRISTIIRRCRHVTARNLQKTLTIPRRRQYSKFGKF